MTKTRFISKPWGSEEILELNNNYMVKKLTMLAGHRCSLQYHKKKRETIFVLSGKLKILKGKAANSLEEVHLITGDSLTIGKEIIHRMEGLTDCIYLEASTPETDDVIRVEDDYNRKSS